MERSVLNTCSHVTHLCGKLMKYLLCMMALIMPMALHAQQVKQQIDSLQILVGQQTALRISVTAHKGASVVFPEFKQSQYLVPGLEVLEGCKPDTVLADDGKMTIDRQYILTSFDARVYAVPALDVKIDGKKFSGNPSALKVLTIPVDTVHPNQFYPPKDVQDNPFMWAEWLPIFLLSLLVLFLFAAMVYLRLRLKQNKPIVLRLRTIRHIPPHEKAMGKINAIKQQTPSAATQKEYYTQLTDTLREYIESRFGFSAREMTSGEIISHLQENGDSAMLDELKHLFHMADLVKFAKYEMQLGENDANLLSAVRFIDQTKTEEKATEEKVAPTLSEQDKKSKSQRRLIKALLWGGAIVIVAVIGYLAYSISQLLM